MGKCQYNGRELPFCQEWDNGNIWTDHKVVFAVVKAKVGLWLILFLICLVRVSSCSIRSWWICKASPCRSPYGSLHSLLPWFGWLGDAVLPLVCMSSSPFSSYRQCTQTLTASLCSPSTASILANNFQELQHPQMLKTSRTCFRNRLVVSTCFFVVLYFFV